MSAAEVIEQIKKLTPEERRKVAAYFDKAMTLNDATVATSQSEFIDAETFERVSKWALQEHRELLSRLAK